MLLLTVDRAKVSTPHLPRKNQSHHHTQPSPVARQPPEQESQLRAVSQAAPSSVAVWSSLPSRNSSVELAAVASASLPSGLMMRKLVLALCRLSFPVRHARGDKIASSPRAAWPPLLAAVCRVPVAHPRKQRHCRRAASGPSEECVGYALREDGISRKGGQRTWFLN